MSDDPGDDLLFADEGTVETGTRQASDWKVLIVDDDEQIHAVTKMVLSDFVFREQSLQFISAYSAAEGRELLAANPDVAVCFLDVVMETDTAGLDLARIIRGELDNPYVRIILRTGQPGQAPERRVIVDYDINDYKEKSELTAQKLFSTMVTALRSYKDIMTIETSRRGLEKIIKASASLFQIRSLEPFLSGVLLQLGSLLDVGINTVMISARPASEGTTLENMRVVGASGRFTALANQPATILEAGVQRAVAEVMQTGQSAFRDRHSVIYFHSRDDRTTVLYIETERPLERVDHRMIELFCGNASLGLDLLS